MMTVTMMNMWYVKSQVIYNTNGNTISSHSLLNVISFLQLEDLEVTVADHIQKVLKPNFAAAWDEVGDECEKEETFALATVRTLDGKLNWNQY